MWPKLVTRVKAGNENRRQTSTLDLCIDNALTVNKFTTMTTQQARCSAMMMARNSIFGSYLMDNTEL